MSSHKKHRTGGIGTIERVSGRYYYAGTASGGGLLHLLLGYTDGTTVGILDQCGKLQQMSDCFQYFRFTKLRLKQTIESAAAGITKNIIGYQPDSLTLPGSFATVVEEPFSTDVIITHFQGASNQLFCYPTNTPWKSVPKSILLSTPTRWFPTRVSGSVDNLFERQGIISIFTTISNNASCHIEFTCEFKGFTAPGLTPKVPLDLIKGVYPFSKSTYAQQDDEKSIVDIPSERIIIPDGFELIKKR